MFNLDEITSKNDNKTWPYRKLIIGPSGSGKTNIPVKEELRSNYIFLYFTLIGLE